jgi:hypothetical protein
MHFCSPDNDADVMQKWLRQGEGAQNASWRQGMEEGTGEVLRSRRAALQNSERNMVHTLVLQQSHTVPFAAKPAFLFNAAQATRMIMINDNDNEWMKLLQK